MKLAVLIPVEALLLLASCGAGNTPNALDVTQYGDEQIACVIDADAAPSSKPLVDACRAASRSRFCARFPTLQTCYPDGGAK